MSDFINKVITIVSKEETKTKDGNNTVIKITDQDVIKYILFKKKKDGTLSSAAEQMRDMGLDEGSIVQISYVIDSYKDAKGEDRTSNKVTGFRETNEQPVKGQAPRPAPVAKAPTYHKESENTVDWDKISVGKCQTVFLAALIQSGKPISEAKLQVVQARQLAELVVYGTQQTEKPFIDDAPLPEPPPEQEVNAEDIPF